MNYCNYVFQVRETWLNNTALVDAGSGRRFSYEELQEVVRRLGSNLRVMGFAPGDVIATHLYNSAEAVIAHLSIQYAGCVSCLLDPLITAEGLSYYVADSGARCLLTHLPRDQVRQHLPDHVQIIEVPEIEGLFSERRGNAVPAYDYAADQVAAIFYTSGTTSHPKGVMLCPANFHSHFRIFTRACYTYDPQDKLLCFVPFSHGYGSKSVFIPCMDAGATLVMMRAFQPQKVVEVLERERITHLFGVPAHYQQLLRRNEWIAPMKKLKAAFSAAAILKLETAREWKERVGFCLDEGYGLIETCTGVAFRRGRMPDRLGHMGAYPRDLVDIEIMDNDQHLLSAGERGEIVVRGPSVMKGYLNKPEETAQVLRNGWFRTGDMGFKSAEGELYLTGRIKDVINIAGIKVAPFEIEAALNEHPDVIESAVVGVEDETYGEVVRAFVQVRQGATCDERDLVRFLQKRLMNFQVPKAILFVDALPRNNMGKVDKNALRMI
jgi:long-chain acyl-CoA synthetase